MSPTRSHPALYSPARLISTANRRRPRLSSRAVTTGMLTGPGLGLGALAAHSGGADNGKFRKGPFAAAMWRVSPDSNISRGYRRRPCAPSRSCLLVFSPTPVYFRCAAAASCGNVCWLAVFACRPLICDTFLQPPLPLNVGPSLPPAPAVLARSARSCARRRLCACPRTL